MATTINAGDLSNATSTVGRSSNFAQAIKFTGNTVLNNVTLATGTPTGAGSNSFFTNTSDTLELNDFYWNITNSPGADDITTNVNHLFRNGAGVILRRGTILCTGRGAGIDNRIGLGSPSTGTQPATWEDMIYIANNVRMIMQLNQFTGTYSNLAVDDFTFGDSRADWNIKAGTFTGFASGVFNSTADTENGNVAGAGGGTLSGTALFDGYTIRRQADLTDTTIPNAPHRSSLKSNYIIFLDTIYLLRDAAGTFNPVAVPADFTQWNQAIGSSSLNADQPAVAGAGVLSANRFSVAATDALGNAVGGLTTWITNADNSAFNAIQCYSITGVTAEDSTNTQGRPSVRTFTLGTPLVNDATIAISNAVTDTLTGFTGVPIPYTIEDNYGFVNTVYGYAKTVEPMQDPLALQIVRNLAKTDLPYIVTEATRDTDQLTSLNYIASRLHNEDNTLLPLVAPLWSVAGTTINFGNVTLNIGDTAFSYTTGGNTINVDFSVVRDTRTTSEAGIAALLILDAIASTNITIDRILDGRINFSANDTLTLGNGTLLPDGVHVGNTIALEGGSQITGGTYTSGTNIAGTGGAIGGSTLNANTNITLGTGTTITAANTWNVPIINDLAVPVLSNQTFAADIAINASVALGLWESNTFQGTNSAINLTQANQLAATDGQFQGVTTGQRYIDIRLWDNTGTLTFNANEVGADILAILISETQQLSGQYLDGDNTELITLQDEFTATFEVPSTLRNGTFGVKNLTTGAILVEEVVIDSAIPSTYSFGLLNINLGTDTFRFVWRPNADATAAYNTTIRDYSEAVDGAITLDSTISLLSNKIVAVLWENVINTDVGTAAMNMIVDGDEPLSGVNRSELQYVNSAGILDDSAAGQGRTLFVSLTALNDDPDYIERILDDDGTTFSPTSPDYIISNGSEVGINAAFCYLNTGDINSQGVTSVTNTNSAIALGDFLPKSLTLTSGGTTPAVVIFANPAGATPGQITAGAGVALDNRALTARNMQAAAVGVSFEAPNGDITFTPVSN